MLRNFRRRRSTPTQEHAQPRFRYENTLPILEESFKDRQYREMPFVKTYDCAGDYIDPPHRRYAETLVRDGMLDIDIEGWLLKADALKRYELSYFCRGDSPGVGNTPRSLHLDPSGGVG